MLQGLLPGVLLLVDLGVLLALDCILHIHWEQIDVACVIGERRVGCCTAERKNLSSRLSPMIGSCGFGQADVHVGVVFARELPPLPVVAMRLPGPRLSAPGLVGGGAVWQRRGCATAQNGSTSRGVELLCMLLISSFAGSGGGLVGLDPRDVVGIVDVP